MIEPPSKQLVKRLEDLGLCSPRDLRRCRGRVKRLAHDLPAFDTVWIDALVQARKLTPFQARILDSPCPERLRVGPCVVIDELGHGPSSTTYLARRRDGNDRCVLRLIQYRPELLAAGLASLEQLVSGLKGARHPSIVAPHACLVLDDELVTVSRYVPGHDLNQYLVRRGRFQAATVAEIARQLLDGLSVLEQNGFVHGDIRPCKVRVASGGVAVLVDAGIGPAVAPELTIHDRRTPQHCDCVAPELIGTGNWPTAASDLYSLGCLLWHLLAGRPPFPSGDPLAKLAAHQTRDIGDVREWAPDTPAPLAEAIGALTARDPDRRPQTFREVREKCGPLRRSGRRRLTKFKATLNASAPRIPAAAHSGSENRWPFLVVVLFALSGAALTLFDEGARPEPLNIHNSQPAIHNAQRTIRNSQSAIRNPNLLPMPERDANGVIQLDADGPYEAKEIHTVGPLTIRGAAGRQPVVLVGQTPLSISATQLTLENVHIRNSQSAIRNPKALLLVQSQGINIRGCSFRTSVLRPSAGSRETAAVGVQHPIAVGWRVIDPNDESGGRVAVADTTFAGAGPALYLSGVPRKTRCTNCLKLGPGAFLTVAAGRQYGRDLRIELKQLTLRQSTALLELKLPEKPKRVGQTVIEADDCVFDLQGHHAALFQLTGGRLSQELLDSIEMMGEGSLSPPDLVVARFRGPGDSAAAALAADAIRLEGISAGRFEFAGPFSSSPGDSTIRLLEAVPRSSPNPPGIDASRLSFPQAAAEAD